MLTLQKQVINSTNWGSSVNGNWTKLEQESRDVWAQFDNLESQINATELGAVFGGFLRFDVTKLAEESEWTGSTIQINQVGTEQNWNALRDHTVVCISATMHLDYDASITDLVTAESRQFFTITKGSSTLPINRIFRIVGKWSKISDEAAPYDTDWSNGNICVYTANTWTQLFWNDYIYQPVKVNDSGELEWEYKEAPTTSTSVTTSFPPAATVETATYMRKIKEGQWTDNEHYSVTIPSAPVIEEVEAGTLRIFTDAMFVTKVSVADAFQYKPLYLDYKMTDTSILIYPDSQDLIDDNDYVIITYYGSK